MEQPTVHDVVVFHRVNRAAYERLLSLGAGPQPASDAVALLMWLVRTPADAARLVSDTLAVLHGVAWPRLQVQVAGTPPGTQPRSPPPRLKLVVLRRPPSPWHARAAPLEPLPFGPTSRSSPVR
ncbi:hypothetical protein ACQ4PT_013210 [Festuca glaucescens]